MNIQDYKKLSARTMSNQWHLSIFDTEQLHCAIGLVTEMGELKQAVLQLPIDFVNVMEEWGDAFWYMAGFQRRYTDTCWEEVELLQEHDINKIIDTAMDSSIEVLDAFKKWAYYGKELNDELIKGHLYTVYRCAYTSLKHIGYTVEEARQINIDKLRKRFPHEFTSQDAITRNLDVERDVLEGK